MSIVKFKPNFVYERWHKNDVPTLQPIQATPDPAPDPVLVPPLRRSTHLRQHPDCYGFTYSSLLATLPSINIPNSYSQAIKQECWRSVMQAELDPLQENHTWDVVSFPPSVMPIGCKWVYSIKLKSDGSLDRYKAHLVALGNDNCLIVYNLSPNNWFILG